MPAVLDLYPDATVVASKVALNFLGGLTNRYVVCSSVLCAEVATADDMRCGTTALVVGDAVLALLMCLLFIVVCSFSLLFVFWCAAQSFFSQLLLVVEMFA